MTEQKLSEEKIAIGSNEFQVLPNSYRLDGRNYLQRAQLVRTTIKGKKKLNHIEGVSLEKTDPKFEAWDDEDSLIMTWLWHSMTPEVSRNCMFFSTAKEIWNYLKQTYSMKKDTTACYEIQTKVFNAKQGNLYVTDYYGTLNGLWIELDQYQNLKMTCTADTTTLAKSVEEARIFKFLHGLNSEFDPIRVQILGKEPLPSLSEVFHTVRGEETRRSVMLEGGGSIEGLALAVGKDHTKGFSSGKPPTKTSRDERYCIHCRKIGHTKETCFKLHGKEKVLERNPGLRGTPQRRANQAAVDSESLEEAPPTGEEIPSLSKSELENIRTLLQSLSKQSSSSSLVMTGSSNGKDDWIC